MRVFVCAGEPSGDLHGGNLVRTLRELQPDVECVGYGGDHMAAAGCQLLYPLCQLAVMGVYRVLANAPRFLDLLSRADRYFCKHRPDAIVLIDYPGFNWWMARRAHFRGIPVYYFVPPQIWAWGEWRVANVQRWIDHVLCTLPFEEAWYKERGVSATFVGHPYFDALDRQQLDAGFLASHSEPATTIGLLPGSRTQEVERNLPTLLGAAERVHAARPEVRFLVACFREAHRNIVTAALRSRNLPIEACVGRTAEVIHLSNCCVAVSGSVGLELLHAGKPTIVVYRIGRVLQGLARRYLRIPYISLVNLLAGRELFPEFLTTSHPSAAVGDQLLAWLDQPVALRALVDELGALRNQVGVSGACANAAQIILDNHRRAGESAPKHRAA
jgi:lipid-A-disaccharide synthase